LASAEGARIAQLAWEVQEVRDWCAARQEGEFIEVFLLPVAGLYEALLVRRAGMPRPETPSQSPRESLGSDPRASLSALR